MSTSILTRFGRRQVGFYRQKPVHANSLKIRLTHNVFPKVTEVEKIILDSIKATGPLPFSTYMQLCLSHPTHGYYMKSSNKVFGSGGDFITSPEISQVFGELVGVWFLSQWTETARHHPFRLVELGPGRGTLMDDILRVVSKHSLHGKAINVHLVETSPAMRALQQAKLERFHIEIHWHNSINEITFSPLEYTMLVAHEFFDALPIHVLQKTQTAWHEVLVAPNIEEEKAESNADESDQSSRSAVTTRLQRVLARNPSTASTVLGHSSPRFQVIPAGSFLEVSPTAFRIAHRISQLLSNKNSEDNLGGCGLIIDYGDDKAFADSFRAFQKHKIVDVFHEPGNCDLTANVDFAYLKEAMNDLVTTSGPISQRVFLEKMGLSVRLQSLMKAAGSEKRRNEIYEAAMRLSSPSGMGEEYKVMGITNKSGESKDTMVWPFFNDEKPKDPRSC